MIEVFRDIAEARTRMREVTKEGRSIGLTPTMGALHDGHLSLIERARSENDCVVVSIFVNSTQYDDPADLKAYPRTFEADLQKAESVGADVVVFPRSEVVYHDDYRFRVTESVVSRKFEGAYRAGHFDGVLTVVLKLFAIVRPDRAYFGEKDWQQYVLVRDMAAAFFLDTEIVPCPVVREPDGLAMSSRNIRLSEDERQLAPEFYRVLSSGKAPGATREALERAGFGVDYVERWEGRVLGAVRLGKVRLIDNVRE